MRPTYSSKLPFLFELKAKRLPSGDHVGHSEKPFSWVIRDTCCTVGVSASDAARRTYMKAGTASAAAATIARAATTHATRARLPESLPQLTLASVLASAPACAIH